jgi:hypothetical protein
LDLLQYQKDAWTTARLRNLIASGTIVGDGSGLTNIPLSGIGGTPLTNNQGDLTLSGLFRNRLEYLSGGDVSSDGSVTRCNSANALAPQYFLDGLRLDGNPGTFSFGVPAWVTQCVFTATLQCTAPTAWTNTVYSFWQFNGNPGRAYNRSDPVTIGSNGLQLFSFVASWPPTNAVKQVQVIFSAATNSPQRILAAPFSLLYN